MQLEKQGLLRVINVRVKGIWKGNLGITDCHDVQPIIIHNTSFQTDDLDAYDSDCDDISSAKAVLMANLLSYDLDVSPSFQTLFLNKLLPAKTEAPSKLPKAEMRLKNDAPMNKAKIIAPRMFKLDLEPLAPKVLKNKDAHIDYIKYAREHADTLYEIVKHARSLRPLDSNLDSAFVGAENLPLMLDKAMYNLWEIRMLMYIKRKKNDRMMLESIKNGPLVYPAIEEDGQIRKKRVKFMKGTELSYQERECKLYNEFDKFTSSQSFAGAGTKENVTSLRGNNAARKARVVKCYNGQGKGHMARKCTHPKRPRNTAWFKEKMLLGQAQESGQVLDEEQLAFLTDDLDSYDLDCDDISSTKAVLMANLLSYDSDFLSEVPQDESYQNNDVLNQRMQEMQSFEQYHVDYVLDTGITTMASEQFSSRSRPHLLILGTLSSGLVPNPPSLTPYVPPTKKDWDTLFQPMFDEYFNLSPSIASLIPVVVAPDPVDSIGSPSSTSVDQMNHLQVPHKPLKKHNF
uniref:Retrovirus-related Pol polyprotein from transposon TNT 1-94 n=1 Tax=Tanacetum cinerariifolium TaxID=118510 RepID=A0A6L2JBH6_TANCI|nr:hypothetical protein [Tanacetum cinerariifolium]